MSRMSLYSRMTWREMMRPKDEEMAKTKLELVNEDLAERDASMKLAAERQAVEAILPYWENQQAESRYRSEKEACGRIIKAFLETHDMQELEDVERGVKAMLQSRRLPNDNWDVSSMDDALVLRLARSGCLLVDKKAIDLKGHAALRMESERYYIPAGETVALRVVKEE